MERLIDFLFKIIIFITGGIFEIISMLLKGALSPTQKTTYSASFKPVGDITSRYNHGFCLTGLQALTKTQSYSNCSVYGPSGSGKSTSVTIPSVYSLSRGESSLCINDPSGEVYTATSGYLASIGYSIHKVDFSDPHSDSFNPLARCKTVSDLQKVAHLIIKNSFGESKGDPFWERSSEMLITLFGRYLLFYAAPIYRTMANLLRLVECFAVEHEKTDRLMIATRDDDLISAYKAMVVYGDKTLQSVIATTRSALNIFSDPTVVQTTASDTIDFTMLKKEKVAVYVCNPVQYSDYFRPLSALFFQGLFNESMSRLPARDERSIFFILDEAATMRFTSLSTTISNIRKYKAGIMLLVQDYMSLVALYGSAEAHNIRTNTFAQIYLKGQPLETCRELETILGRFSYQDGQSERTRQLMTIDELRTTDDAIILCGNHAPMKARMVQYFNRGSLQKRAAMEPFQPEYSATFDQLPPVIPLP